MKIIATLGLLAALLAGCTRGTIDTAQPGASWHPMTHRTQVLFRSGIDGDVPHTLTGCEQRLDAGHHLRVRCPGGYSITFHAPIWAQGAGNHIRCGKFTRVCLANLKAGSRWEPFRDYDGHHHCAILVGDTSVFACRDGFVTDS